MTRIKGKGPEAEVKEVFATIPTSFDDLVHKAAKDNNKLQHKINVHEHALNWIRIYEESKHKQNICCRLEDCLLLGTSAAFTAIPSCRAMQIKHKQLAFRLRMQFGLKSKLGGFCEEDAFQLALAMGKRATSPSGVPLSMTHARMRCWTQRSRPTSWRVANRKGSLSVTMAQICPFARTALSFWRTAHRSALT